MTILVIVAAAWCVALLAAALVRAGVRGGPRVRAVPRGHAVDGLVYVFGPAMRPWAKDGARRHPAVVGLGLVYHLGVAAGAVMVGALVVAGWQPTSLGVGVRGLLALLLVFATGAGLSLLLRRLRDPALRRISVPDDYVSNAIVTLFLAATLAWLIGGAFDPLVLGAASALLLYAPLGKIRHCVFYPVARVALGLRLGRRGVVGRRAQGAGA
ncbi:MAG: hypothetical protein KJ066_11620 [Acidobacteria bacterium]|nr:hypothetical protein [Acidobacteriota bacterium]